MAAEILLLGESNSVHCAYLNMLLGVLIMPEAANSRRLPAIRIQADQPAGLWLRQHPQQISTPALFSWHDVPADWLSFAHIEMTFENHPLLNKGLILWSGPSIDADEPSQRQYLDRFLSDHEQSVSSVLFFVPGTISREAVTFLIRHPKLRQKTTIVSFVKEYRNDRQRTEIERSARDAVKRGLNDIPFESFYVGDMHEEFLALAEERRRNLLEAEVIRMWSKTTLDIETLAVKYERPGLSARLAAVAESTVKGITVDFQTMNNLVLANYASLGDDEARLVLARRLLANSEYDEAIKHFERLAGKNQPEALATLASCFGNGLGVKQNQEKANQYWKRAADAGIPEAQYHYAHIMSEEGTQGDQVIPLLKKAAEAGHVKANAELGRIYVTGTAEQKNYEKAIPCLKLAADAGEADAMFLLGKCYQKAWGVKKDVMKAIELWEAAAGKNQVEALVELGDLYMLNVDRPRNPDRAMQYYLKTAEFDHPPGFFRIGSCYDRGEGVAQDDQKAAEYYRYAAEKGFTMAQHNLGICYWQGQGCEKDLEWAKYWLRKAASSGYEESTKALTDIETEEANLAKKKCFVVTAAFGDIDAPEVVFFRHVRDTSLERTAPGRFLIAVYYQIGPTLAAYIDRHDRLKRCVRHVLIWVMTTIRDR